MAEYSPMMQKYLETPTSDRCKPVCRAYAANRPDVGSYSSVRNDGGDDVSSSHPILADMFFPPSALTSLKAHLLHLTHHLRGLLELLEESV